MPDTALQPFNPLTRASIRPIRQRRDIPSFPDPSVQLEPSETMQPRSQGQPDDLQQSIKALWSQYQKQSADTQKAIDPLQASINDLSSRIVDTTRSMEPEDPYELDTLKNNAQEAQTQTEKAALELRGPQTSDYTPFEFNQPYPKQGTLPVPERPEAKVNPVASILAGIGGFIAPQGAAHFASSAIQGAVQRASQTYQDALRTRQMKLEELEQNHKDELAARNETLKIAEDNFERDQANDLANLLAEGKYAEAHSKLEGELAKEKFLGENLPGLSVRAKAKNRALGLIQTMKEEKAKAEASVKLLMAQQEKTDALKEHLIEHQIASQDKKYSTDEISKLRQEMINAGYVKSGYTPSPVPGGLPTPTPYKSLPEKQKSEIDLSRARTKEQGSLRDYHMAQIDKIRSGKPADLTKATPAQRLAMQAMSGAQKAYDVAVAKKLEYLRTRKKGSGKLESDPIYIGLDRANADTARELQAAHKAAVEAVGGKYGGKIGPKARTKSGSVPLPRVNSTADAKKLPKGAHFIGPDGNEYIN